VETRTGIGMSGARPINICFATRLATSLFYPDLPPTHGGSDTQFYLNARELARRDGVRVDAVVQGEWGRPSELVDGVRVHFFPFGPGIGPKLRLQQLLARIDADIYLQQGVGSVTKEMAFFALWRRRRFVYWVASDYDVDPAVARTDVHRSRSFQWGMLRARLIVAQTGRQAEALRRNYGREGVIVANGFPARNPPPYEPTAGGRDCILWVGRFVSVKRPELFIELARRLPHRRFLMIGPTGADDARADFERLRPLIEATTNLEYNPGMPLQAIAGQFDRASLFVNTSITEGFPNTFVQAMWSATPIASLAFDPDGIVATRALGVAPETAATNDAIDAFAARIDRFLADPAACRSASANALAHAREHHDLEKNMDRLLAALRNIA
jgi:glycosyltransferase involved in cell wall biosynthesis